MMFPSADGFHDRSDPRYSRFLDDEFNGIDSFPSMQVSQLAVHGRVVSLAELLLADDDLRIYSAEAWAKYTGAADYDQGLHRDYLNHTILVPSTRPGCQQLELPGHQFWTAETASAMQLRYPGTDWTTWL